MTNPGGGAQIDYVQMLFNTSVTGVNGCYMKVVPGGSAPYINTVQLAVNNGTGWTEEGVSLGTAGKTLENSQCRLNVATSSLTTAGNGMTVVLSLTFKPGFTGMKTTYMQAHNTTGAGTDWAQVGTWDLTANPAALAPSMDMTAPAAGATVSGTATLTGWALDNATRSENVITSVEVFVDGASKGYATLNQSSTICNTYPNRPGCPNVGWVFYWATGPYSNGTHTLRVVATDYDNPPHTTELTRTVTVNNVTSQPVVVSPALPYLAMTNGTVATQQFTATVGGVPSTAVDWSLVEIAPCLGICTGSITTAGLYTPPLYGYGSPGNQLYVKAVRQANPSDWAQTTVTLMGWLSPARLTMYAGQGGYFYSTLGNVTYSLSPNLGSVNGYGYYVAPYSGYTPGTKVKITATDVGNPLRRQVAEVTLQ